MLETQPKAEPLRTPENDRNLHQEVKNLRRLLRGHTSKKEAASALEMLKNDTDGKLADAYEEKHGKGSILRTIGKQRQNVAEALIRDARNAGSVDVAAVVLSEAQNLRPLEQEVLLTAINQNDPQEVTRVNRGLRTLNLPVRVGDEPLFTNATTAETKNLNTLLNSGRANAKSLPQIITALGNPTTEMSAAYEKQPGIKADLNHLIQKNIPIPEVREYALALIEHGGADPVTAADAVYDIHNKMRVGSSTGGRLDAPPSLMDKFAIKTIINSVPEQDRATLIQELANKSGNLAQEYSDYLG